MAQNEYFSHEYREVFSFLGCICSHRGISSKSGQIPKNGRNSCLIIIPGKHPKDRGSKKTQRGYRESKPGRPEFLKELLKSKKIVSVIDSVYPSSEAPEAIKYYEEGDSRGRVINNII
jgi:NADPH:quinone reductase-like Zn-dependent oxidoreductase